RRETRPDRALLRLPGGQLPGIFRTARISAHRIRYDRRERARSCRCPRSSYRRCMGEAPNVTTSGIAEDCGGPAPDRYPATTASQAARARLAAPALPNRPAGPEPSSAVAHVSTTVRGARIRLAVPASA